MTINQKTIVKKRNRKQLKYGKVKSAETNVPFRKRQKCEGGEGGLVFNCSFSACLTKWKTFAWTKKDVIFYQITYEKL